MNEEGPEADTGRGPLLPAVWKRDSPDLSSEAIREEKRFYP